MTPPLPHNDDAERAVLSCVLLDNRTLDTALWVLGPEDFFNRCHARIFARMVEMKGRAETIDLITLTEELRGPDQLSELGGTAYIASLADCMPVVSNVERYARIVQEKASLRRLAHFGQSCIELATKDEGNIDQVLAKMKSLAEFAERDSKSGRWRDRFHTYQDVVTAPPLQFAIGKFLQSDGVTMIAGLSGHSKTLLMLSIVKALLKGKGATLWDLFPVEDTAERVIYLIPESTLPPFAHRMQLFKLDPYLSAERLLVRTLSKGPTPSLRDPGILQATKNSYVFLDTAVRFSAQGDENSASDVSRGLVGELFGLLSAGARAICCAHHSPKSFAAQSVMTLESVLRGSGDIGAAMSTAWGIKQIDSDRNIVYIENLKSRDFESLGPFELLARPAIDQTGDFQLFKRPGECGQLADEQYPHRDKGGAPMESRQERVRRIEIVRQWLSTEASLSAGEIRNRFAAIGIDVSRSACKNYRRLAAKE
jgi:DnaB-like helicase N terminal domain/AAA domain